MVRLVSVQKRLLQVNKNSKNSPLLVDIGGGRGQDLVAFTQKFPGVKKSPILQDLPSVIASNSKLEGIEQMEYNFFTPQSVRGKPPVFPDFSQKDS